MYNMLAKDNILHNIKNKLLEKDEILYPEKYNRERIMKLKFYLLKNNMTMTPSVRRSTMTLPYTSKIAKGRRKPGD